MLTMWSKYVGLKGLAKDIGKVVVVRRNSREIRIIRSGRSGEKITFGRAKLQTELD